MLLICPHCKQQYNIEEGKIPPNVKNVKCKNCGQQFPLQRTPAASPQSSPSPLVTPGSQPVRRIGVCISKGGVGKTTTSVNLAAGLAYAGYRVLLVDTDTQGQDSFVLGVRPKGGLTELVTEELTPEEAIFKARERLWLLAGGKSLAGLKRLIDRKDFGGELTIAETLKKLESQFDYIVVDTSPGWDPLTVNVLFYVNEVLTPVSLEIMTLQGLVEFLKSLSAIQKHRKDVALKYILPTFHDQRVKKCNNILEKIQELYGHMLCKPIRHNVHLSESPSAGQTIFEFAPGSTGAEDYRELVRKVANNDKLFR
ncbi:AAA family ATPase [Desulfurivibrio dismutans]|uniref:AAA family ATPase n=1 Tax=Desulfurivibrio dismutans TaxID=1398908 RepID=UPI0023DC55CD|nr:AAA family ATPase [Desulfurivibrio alkaliphilus]MDF1615048.1 AAA family ATPase [Desulfurivibrio alkaliphilus]